MLLDTSRLLCLLHRQEAFHEQARAEYHRASAYLTHGFVLAELVALANARGLPQAAVLSFLQGLVDDFDTEIVWPDRELTAQAITLLMTRQDQNYSLCDAVSFVLMRQRNVHEALTTDHHFEQEGFQKLLG